MASNSGGTILDDIAYLSRSDHRVPMLVALSVRPRSRSELWELTGVSSSTVRRTIREFEDRHWIQRDGYQYQTTHLGTFIANAMSELVDRFETERKLREVWEWLPDEASAFSIELCPDAVVTIASASDPYRPTNRFAELLEGAARARFVGIDVALLEPCKEGLCREIVGGTDAEMIIPPRVANYVRSNCPDLFSDTLESGNLTLRLHDDLPKYGLSIIDDRVVISGYDPDSVTVRVVLDTGTAEAREWAESVYQRYWRQTPTVPLDIPSE